MPMFNTPQHNNNQQQQQQQATTQNNPTQNNPTQPTTLYYTYPNPAPPAINNGSILQSPHHLGQLILPLQFGQRQHNQQFYPPQPPPTVGACATQPLTNHPSPAVQDQVNQLLADRDRLWRLCLQSGQWPQQYQHQPGTYEPVTPSPFRVSNSNRHSQPTTTNNNAQDLQHAINRITTLHQQLETANCKVSRLQADTNRITTLQQQLETANSEVSRLQAANNRITTLHQQLETVNSKVSRLQAECDTKDVKISTLVDEKAKLEEQLQEALLRAHSSAVNQPTGDTTQHHHCLHYNPQTDTVLDISTLSEEIIRQYAHQHQNTYKYSVGGLSNLHTHINNVKLSLQANIDASKPKHKCILCYRKNKKCPQQIFLEMCTDCYKTQVTRLTYEDIFAKEIMHAMPDFNHRQYLPLPTTNYEADIYCNTEDALVQIEIDGTSHVTFIAPLKQQMRRYYMDALRSKHISEENSICNGTCTNLIRVYHGDKRVPDEETVEFVIDLLQSEFSDVPGGHYNTSQDLVLLLNYDINKYRSCLQVRRYISIYGTNVVRVLRYNGTQFVNVDLTNLLQNQITGK